MVDLYRLRVELAAASRGLYDSRLAGSTGGNISQRTDDLILISKTDTAFGRLQPTDIIICDLSGNPLEEGKPSKEVGLHVEVYRQRPAVKAVVHVHSTYAIALGAFALDKQDVLPPCTYGAVTRVGKVPWVEYHTPGQAELFRSVGEKLPQAENALYLAKHGMVTFAQDLGRACDVAEEFEQNAKLYVVTGGVIPLLTQDEVLQLREVK